MSATLLAELPTPTEARALEEAIQLKALVNLDVLSEQIALQAADEKTPLTAKLAAAEFNYKLSKLAQARAVEVGKASRPITSIVYPDGKIVAIGGSGDTQTLLPSAPANTSAVYPADKSPPARTVETTEIDVAGAEMEAAFLGLPDPPAFLAPDPGAALELHAA